MPSADVRRLQELLAALRKMYIAYERFDEARLRAEKPYQQGSAILTANERYKELLLARDEAAALLGKEKK